MVISSEIFIEDRSSASAWNQHIAALLLSIGVDALGLIEVTNESYENPAAHQYTVSIDDVTHELMACTCSSRPPNAVCKHMAAVQNATEGGTLDAFPSKDDNDAKPYDCDCDGLSDFPC